MTDYDIVWMIHCSQDSHTQQSKSVYFLLWITIKIITSILSIGSYAYKIQEHSKIIIIQNIYPGCSLINTDLEIKLMYLSFDDRKNRYIIHKHNVNNVSILS